jgi:hypothetical protein
MTLIALMRALSAEFLKIKRTLALLVALALPTVVILINFVMFLRNRSFEEGSSGWDYFVSSNMLIWGLLMLTLYITLETALLASLEHNHQGWKHLAALPIPSAAVYAAKQIMAMGMVALSMAVIVLGTWATATVTYVLNLNPLASFVGTFPWALLLRTAAQSYLLSLLIIAIHSWIATRFANFAFASAVGIAATVLSFFASQDSDLMRFFPWSLPMTPIMQLMGNEADLAAPMAVSLLGALVVSVVGGWNVVTRDVL